MIHPEQQTQSCRVAWDKYCSYNNEVCMTDSRNPLLCREVLQNVLSYVGAGQYLFVALVSRLWKDVYGTARYRQLAFDEIRSCGSLKLTLGSSVFASPSRVWLARLSGLDGTTKAYQHAAGKYADVGLLATAHCLGMQYTAATMRGAANRNKLAEVQFLHRRGCPWSLCLLEDAAQRGHFELVRWCYEHGCAWDDASSASKYAAKSGNVELMAWLLQQPDTQLSTEVMAAAAAEGHTALCHFLHAQQCPWDTNSTNNAAMSGDLELLRWFLDSGCPWDARRLCTSATAGGSVEMLVFLQQQILLTRAADVTYMLGYAAEHNKLAAAKWLREQGAEWPRPLSMPFWTKKMQAWARSEGYTGVRPPLHTGELH
jgi:hypothetical protein